MCLFMVKTPWASPGNCSMSWQLQAFSLWFVLSCHLTPPPRACITLNAKMPCYQTLLSGAPGMLMETFLKVFPVSWKWSVPSPGPVLGQSWGQTSTSVWTGSISAGQGPSEPLWENTQALLLRVCWRLGWTWGGDCSIASCSKLEAGICFSSWVQSPIICWT